MLPLLHAANTGARASLHIRELRSWFCFAQPRNGEPRQAFSRFRAEWTQGPRTSLKKLERLRAFFRFAQKRKWVAENPASELKAPKITLRPTLPLTQEEMMRTVAAVEKYKEATSSNGMENARRLRGLLLRYSGMRISDAVQLTADRITGRLLFLYMQKTGEPVNVVLPDFVLKALETAPRVTDKHFFWSGEGKLDSIVRSWQAAPPPF